MLEEHRQILGGKRATAKMETSSAMLTEAWDKDPLDRIELAV